MHKEKGQSSCSFPFGNSKWEILIQKFEKKKRVKKWGEILTALNEQGRGSVGTINLLAGN